MPDLGLIFYNLPGYDLVRFVEFASAAGFTCAEVAARDIWGDADFPTALRKARDFAALLAEHGMHLSAVSAGNDFIQSDDQAFQAQLERLRQVCLLAREAGTSVVRVDGGHPKDDRVPPDRWFSLIVRGLSAMREFIEAEGFILALDNHGITTNDADFQVRVLEAVGSRNVGANLDTMNYRWFGHDLATVDRFYRVIAPYVRHTHFKDGRGSRADYRGTALGEGELHLEVAVQALRDVGYTGPWVVEYEGRSDHEEGYRRGLRWLRAHLVAEGH